MSSHCIPKKLHPVSLDHLVRGLGCYLVIVTACGQSADVVDKVLPLLSKSKITRLQVAQLLANLRGWHYKLEDANPSSTVKIVSQVERMRELEAAAFTDSFEVFGNGEAVMALDDEQIPCRSAYSEIGKPRNRKRGDGSPSEALNDSFFGACLWRHLSARGEPSWEMQWIPDAVKTCLKGSLIYCDRGVIGNALCRKLNDLGASVAGVMTEQPAFQPWTRGPTDDIAHFKIGSRAECSWAYMSAHKYDKVDESVPVADRPPRVCKAVCHAIRDPYTGKYKNVSKILKFYFTGNDCTHFAKAPRFLVLRPYRDRNTKKAIRRTLWGESQNATLRTTSRLQEAEVTLRADVDPRTRGQRCYDWFSQRRFCLTGTVASTLASYSPVVCRALGQPHEPRESDPEIMRLLSKSWFARTKSTTYMKEGQKNEELIFNALLRYDWCIDLFEVGMVASRSVPWLKVSTDAVGTFTHPDTNEQFLAPVEMKTRCTDKTTLSARQVADSPEAGGFYKSVDAGTASCIRAVQGDHTFQLLHTAAVFNSSRVVYVVSTTEGSGIVYARVVNFPDSLIMQYREHMHSFSHLFQWFYSNKPTLPFAPVETTPSQAPAPNQSPVETTPSQAPAPNQSPAPMSQPFDAAPRGTLVDEPMEEVVAEGGNAPHVAQGSDDPGLIFVDPVVYENLRTHFPHCLLLERYINRWGPLPPIKCVYSDAQVMYNKAKPGVDRASQYAERLTNRELFKLKWEQSMVLRMFVTLIVNTFLAQRMMAISDGCEGVDSNVNESDHNDDSGDQGDDNGDEGDDHGNERGESRDNGNERGESRDNGNERGESGENDDSGEPVSDDTGDLSLRNEDISPWLGKVRSRVCARTGSLAKFAYELGKLMLERGDKLLCGEQPTIAVEPEPEPEPASAPVTDFVQPPPGCKRKHRFWHEPVPTAFRLSKEAPHRLTKQQTSNLRCVVCGGRASFRCEACGEVLHAGHGGRCNFIFHNQRTFGKPPKQKSYVKQ